MGYSRYTRGYAWCTWERVWVKQDESVRRPSGLIYCPNCGCRLRVRRRQPRNGEYKVRITAPELIHAWNPLVKQAAYNRGGDS